MVPTNKIYLLTEFQFQHMQRYQTKTTKGDQYKFMSTGKPHQKLASGQHQTHLQPIRWLIGGLEELKMQAVLAVILMMCLHVSFLVLLLDLLIISPLNALKLDLTGLRSLKQRMMNSLLSLQMKIETRHQSSSVRTLPKKEITMKDKTTYQQPKPWPVPDFAGYPDKMLIHRLIN